MRFDAQDGTFIDEVIAPGEFGIDAPVFLAIVPEPSAIVGMALFAVVLARRRAVYRGASLVQ